MPAVKVFIGGSRAVARLNDPLRKRLDRIIAERVEPNLAADEWGAAIAAAATGLDEAIGGTTEPAPEEPGEQPGTTPVRFEILPKALRVRVPAAAQD